MTVNIHYTIDEIAEIISGKWLAKNEQDSMLSYLSLDSRKIIEPELTVFFAIATRNQDANLFIKTLYQKGVRNFVTDHSEIDFSELPDVNILVVENTVEALQKLSIHHRNHFNELLVIGITGSNGKTIVKEWLYQLFNTDFAIVRSPKSFNSQIGVPLSVLNINDSNGLGIFEAGISLPGEMEQLEKIIQPVIGILTNIGNAHDEGFANRQQKLKEKLKLFKHAKVLIFGADNSEIIGEILHFQKENRTLELFSWGKNKSCTLQITGIHKENSGVRIKGIFAKKSYSIIIPYSDEASIENAINCWCVLLFLGKTDLEFFARFGLLEAVAMRLELKPGINRCTIINDSYSNDLQSLSIALDFLKQQWQHPEKTVIFSDILQSGLHAPVLYQKVASLLLHHQVDQFIGIGPDILANKAVFSVLKNTSFFESTDEFLKNIQLHLFRDETILIKGARRFEFEKISHLLEQKVHQTVLSINLNNLVFNLKKYKEQLQPSTKIMAMVKAFSYGSGSREMAAVLEYNKVDYLGVAYADEGIELRNAGITLPIMVMNIDESAFDAIVNNNLEPELFSFKILHSFLHFLKQNNLENYPVHLKIDTGMHRLGFMENEMSELVRIINQNKFIKIKSVFSHLAASDDTDKDNFTMEQFDTLKRCSKQLEEIVDYPFLKHICNTSGISRFPQLQMDMVRLGIGLYGIDSNEKMQSQLKNVSTLKTTISQIKKIKTGETVGYGRMGKPGRDSIIATVRLGYADGYPRILGNGNGKMLLHGQLVPVIGNVCMDMTMLDITGIENVQEGEEVIVFGEGLSLQNLAFWAHTIPYEIMTGISSRVKRVYFEE